MIEYNIYYINYFINQANPKIKYMPQLNTIVDFNPVTRSANYLFSHSKLLQRLSNYLADLFCKNTVSTQAGKLLFAIGAISITYKFIHFLHTQYKMWKWIPAYIHNQKQLSAQGLKTKYGDCYVVVTGCTQGIGLSFALEFAKMDFGVVLVARNPQKLERRIIQIKNVCPRFRYQKVIGDFSKVQDLKKIGQQLIELTNKIDIGIVVNNAGHVGSKFQNFILKDPKQLKDILTVNFLGNYEVNSALLPILRKRKNHRSAILNLSSCTGVFISQGNGTYTASKMMQDIYSRTLSIENRDKIDIISVRPFGVRTPMMGMKKGKFMISPKQCVHSTLADLGNSDTTWTGFMHKVQASFLQRMSQQQVFQTYDKLFSKVNK